MAFQMGVDLPVGMEEIANVLGYEADLLDATRAVQHQARVEMESALLGAVGSPLMGMGEPPPAAGPAAEEGAVDPLGEALGVLGMVGVTSANEDFITRYRVYRRYLTDKRYRE